MGMCALRAAAATAEYEEEEEEPKEELIFLGLFLFVEENPWNASSWSNSRVPR